MKEDWFIKPEKKMMQEQNYDFIKRLRAVHQPDRRNLLLRPETDELEIDSDWKIVIGCKARSLVRRAAEDFQNYLQVSQNVSIPLVQSGQLVRAPKTILLTVASDGVWEAGRKPVKPRGFLLDISKTNGVFLCGTEERGVFTGAIHMEDRMNLREAPFLKCGCRVREPLCRMRSVHSGCGMDDFPDWHLNAIAHAGFTAIELFVKAPDTTTNGFCNINDVIERAASYGLDVVLYCYLSSYKHPDDPDAEAFFDSVYGEIFRRHPGFAAIHLVGESLEFPSRDPRTTGKRYDCENNAGIEDVRPSPGWYPCSDYPAYIRRVADAVHKVKPEAEVILNTYNWGWAPPELRSEFLKKLPSDITIQSTYDIFKVNRWDGLCCRVMDYSISAARPGFYFSSEVKAASEAGFRHMRVTGNLAGSTWDFGTAPYVPVPYRWLTRMKILKQYLLKYGVDSFYDNHHYGWWPNPCIDLAKEIFTSGGETDLEDFLRRVAVRDYGSEAAPRILNVWKTWSRAMEYYTCSNEDQYGPWRTGPSYPFLFQPNMSRAFINKTMKFPYASYSHFAWEIIKPYVPYESEYQSPAQLRYPVELKRLERMLGLWSDGLTELEAACPLVPAAKSGNGERLYALGKFIRNSIITTINMKRWWKLNIRLQDAEDRDTMDFLLDQMEELADREIGNARDTIDSVRTDSRLGWEPSMEYVCDEWHLNWKIHQMESMKNELSAYRKIIHLHCKRDSI